MKHPTRLLLAAAVVCLACLPGHTATPQAGSSQESVPLYTNADLDRLAPPTQLPPAQEQARGTARKGATAKVEPAAPAYDAQRDWEFVQAVLDREGDRLAAERFEQMQRGEDMDREQAEPGSGSYQIGYPGFWFGTPLSAFGSRSRVVVISPHEAFTPPLRDFLSARPPGLFTKPPAERTKHGRFTLLSGAAVDHSSSFFVPRRHDGVRRDGQGQHFGMHRGPRNAPAPAPPATVTVPVH